MTNGKADNHEGIDFYRPVEKPDKSKPLWGENQWPTIPGFKESFDDWIAKMKQLGLIVMEASVSTLPLYPPLVYPEFEIRMAVGLGMRPEEWEELRNQVDDSFWVMRIIGSPLSAFLS